MCACNCCCKGNQPDTLPFVGCAFCADRSEHLPLVAALCLGTSLSLEIPVLQRGGKRQERAEMEQAVCICTCRHGRGFFLFFCVYSDMEEVEPENPKASLKCLNEVH